MLIAHVVAALASLADPLPQVVITADDTVIDRSCRVAVPEGIVIADANGDGVIHVSTPGVALRFESGSVLRGGKGDPDSLTGIGISVRGAGGVTIAGARIEGFKVGVRATDADGITIEDCAFSGMFRQRLGSTPLREDAADWLTPHHNDGDEWVTRYGAAVSVVRSKSPTVVRCRAREGQNGVILDRVTGARVFDNDCSFLSGWGLALWRSSGNLISRNAFDWCVRGYGHGVYNRGQDSAGILMFEQCSGNTIIENSATHCGDGFFGFAGKEALGETKPPSSEFDYTRRGCNDNLIIGNDFSYAAAHGVEITFSFGNLIERNRLIENGICGVWAGYSADTEIIGNTIENNGVSGRSEGGGINIEHGRRNRVSGNRFARNSVGVSLWWDEDRALAKTPWAKANGVASHGTVIAGNEFLRDAVAVQLRATDATTLAENRYTEVERELIADDTSEACLTGASDIPSRDTPTTPRMPQPALGDTTPVGARAALAGRAAIVMGEWGPWDHESPMLRLRERAGAADTYELFSPPDATGIEIEAGPAVAIETEQQADIAGGQPLVFRVLSSAPGVHAYALRVSAEGTALDELRRGELVNSLWRCRSFAWTIDPREDLAGWRAESASPAAVEWSADTIDLRFNSNGPSQMKLGDAISGADLPRDRFGTIASTVIPLPPGTWRVITTSDDGVRVTVRTGGVDAPAEAQPALSGPIRTTPRTIIERWDQHGPTTDRAVFEVAPNPTDGAVDGTPAPIPVEIAIEHFELDGSATLTVRLERV